MTASPAIVLDVHEHAAVIFDIDGTLALIDHRRHHVVNRPKNWKAFYAAMSADVPNIPVINTLHGLMRVGYKGIICSGRPDDHRAATEKWLARHYVSYNRLYMRKAGDFRADDIVKRELLEQMRDDDFVPILACDDRDRVVAMWRSEGLICLQAALGDF
jgi:hypothetical protein